MADIKTRDAVSHNILEMSGSRAVWKDVFAVYAVKTNTNEDDPQGVAMMDDSKRQILKDIFWEMNQISSRTEIPLRAVQEMTAESISMP